MNIQTISNGTIQSISSNPFLGALEEYVSTDKLGERLSTSPLTGVDIRNLGMQERLDLLDRLSEEFFEPTSTSLEIVIRLLRLIRKGYINRDPSNPKVRRLTMELASYGGYELSRLPWSSINAKGMTIYGITGVGKTYDIERGLNLLPQYIEHGENKKAGWKRMTQIVWLKVGMSHDGSLGGLLLQILVAIDEAIGTMYSLDNNLIRLSNEKLAVRLGIVLRNHGVGVLVIDEIQERNFQGYGRGEFAATFFLRLLNFGIPIVLIGNPFGIRVLYLFSQDMRRISAGGSFYVHPLEETDYDWNKCLAPALSKLNLLDAPHQVSNFSTKLFEYSGGIRGYAQRILAATQRLALDLGKSYITDDLMQMASMGADFIDKERDIISAFKNKNPIPLIQYDDIPWEDYANRWGFVFDTDHLMRSNNKATASKSTEQKEESDNKPVPQKDLEIIKRRRTRQANYNKGKALTRQNLSKEDIRMNGLQEHLINNFNSIQTSQDSLK